MVSHAISAIANALQKPNLRNRCVHSLLPESAVGPSGLPESAVGPSGLPESAVGPPGLPESAVGPSGTVSVGSLMFAKQVQAICGIGQRFNVFRILITAVSSSSYRIFGEPNFDLFSDSIIRPFG